MALRRLGCQTGEQKVNCDITRHRYSVFLTCGEQDDENVQRSKPSSLYALEQIWSRRGTQCRRT